MSCERCPCPDACLALPAYCAWAAREPADPVQIRNICDGSRARRNPAGPPAYPPLMQQAANLAGAVGRVVAAAVKGGPIRVSPEVHRERLAACMGCEFNGARPAGVRCLKCGCGGMKLEFATEHCPLPEPKW